jgi:hypothetical protein
MKNNLALRIISILLIAILVANIVLFAFGKIKVLLFWLVIAAGFVMAKYLLPLLRKKV